jgi:hypothetical protein
MSGRTHSSPHSLFRDDLLSAAEQRYLKALDLAPGVNQLLGSKGRMVYGEAELATVRRAISATPHHPMPEKTSELWEMPLVNFIVLPVLMQGSNQVIS